MKRIFHKAVVTGGRGFLGRHLVQRLLAEQMNVIAVDRRPFYDMPCTTLVCDLRKKGCLDGILDESTVVFHCAGTADVTASIEDPRADFENNCVSLFEILESARKARSRVLFTSTASIFDPQSPSPLSEKTLVRPSSPYGAAKLACEGYCVAYARSYDMDVRVARLFSVYGVGMRRFAIHDIIQRLLKNPKELTVFGDGQQVRDYLYVDDAVEGLMTIALKGSRGEDYNLASGDPVVIVHLARMIADVMGCVDVKIIARGEAQPGIVPRFYGDISKIRSIGFQPQVSLRDGLQRTIDWLKTT